MTLTRALALLCNCFGSISRLWTSHKHVSYSYQLTVLCDDGMTEVDVPSTWTAIKSGERFMKVELDANSDEYRRIEQNARATSQNSLNQIIKVHHRESKTQDTWCIVITLTNVNWFTKFFHCVTPLWTWQGEFLNVAYPRPILSKFYSILSYPYLSTANSNSYHFRADTM